MAVISVTGAVKAETLGVVLPHEHMLVDLRPLVCGYTEITRQNAFLEKVCLQNHGLLMRNPYAALDNALLNEPDIQRGEAMAYRRAGGGTIVDATPRELGRDPAYLRALSIETGLTIVMGSGHYLRAMHPAKLDETPVEQLADEIATDILEGVPESGGIRAGVIGEIGTGDEIHPMEFKALHAASIAQKRTGAGIHIHASLWNRNGIQAARFAIEHGANPEKICVDHVDALLDMEYIHALIKMGVYVEFDNIGKEYYVDGRYRGLLRGSFATDRDRARRLAELVDAGYADKLLLSNDICLKTMTHHYGGWGYDHILTNFAGMMRDCGISRDAVQRMLIANPARFLDVQEEN